MRNYANWIKAYMSYTRLSESPDQFHLWTAIGTVAGALRGKVWFDMGHFRWTPNFFIVFVAKPGIASKSSTAGIGMKLLRDIEDVRFGPNSITWQALIVSLGDANLPFALDPEKGLAGPIQNFSCLTFFASELGTLLNMKKDEGLVDALTDLWDGSLSSDSWSKQTMTYKVTVENPWVNILACTTPSWIAENIPKQAIGGGFVSRCVFVWADEKRRLSPYPKLEAKRLGIDMSIERQALVDDLREIAGLVGEFTLDAEAEEFGAEWYEAHNRNPNRGFNANGDMSGYMARKQAHSHKLAMVISAARNSSMIISRQDLEDAMGFLEMSEATMPKVFRGIHANVEMAKAARIVEFLQALPSRKCGRSPLYRNFMGEMSTLEFNGFIDALTVAGTIEVVNEGGTMVFKLKG